MRRASVLITLLVTLVAGLMAATSPAAAQQAPGTIAGTVTDRHTGTPVAGICALVHDGTGSAVVGEAVTDEAGSYAVPVPPGDYRVLFLDCAGWEYAADWRFDVAIAAGQTVSADAGLTTGSLTGVVDVATGTWHLAAPRRELAESFIFGNPGDLPFVGDWDCDGVDTPGLYRQSDGFVYLRNSNTPGLADVRFFLGNPGDVPLAGDFDGDGCDTVSVYRPAGSQVFVVNALGADGGGLGAAESSFVFGDPGDRPFVGDFDRDGVDTVGLHREATGLVYFRNSLSAGPADVQFTFGDPGDRVVAGDFEGLWRDTVASFRPGDSAFHVSHAHAPGPADRAVVWEYAGPEWVPVAGAFGL